MSREKLVVVVALLGLAAFLTGGAGASSGGYRDAAGDGSGAPDVTQVTVTESGGSLTFSIRTASAAAWSNAAAIVSVDADANPASGTAGGFEYFLTLHSLHDTLTVDRWNGQTYESVQSSATFSLVSGTLVVTVPAVDLGSPSRFRFSVSTPASSGEDRAPDTGSWLFDSAATVTKLEARFSPTAPKHGAVFSVRSVSATRSDGSFTAATPTCSARLAGKRLSGGCRWKIPSTARAKTLVVTVHVGSVARAYRFRVR